MRGEVWWVDFGGGPAGSEPKFSRPAVIIQSDDFERLNTLIVVPTTSQLRRASQSGSVRIKAGIGGLQEDSVALCHQLTCLDRSRLVEKLGELRQEELSEIEIAVAYVLGLAL